MRLVIQRVISASVEIDSQVVAKINRGLLVLLGIEHVDNETDVEWLCGKLEGLRIFSDEEGKMNLSLKDINGSILLVSQFTLFASTKKGNRPSFIQSAKPEHAITLYNYFIKMLRSKQLLVETGVFGADMNIQLVNQGPVTILMDSKNRE
jgi:D-aminoacyl-tRNA deacylase